MEVPVARAQLVDEGYSLDMVEIPVLGAGRVVSMGGAFVALAEGIDGVPFNPAAYAVRNPREHHFFEWEISPSVSFGTSKNDLFNSGRGRLQVDDMIFLDVGLRLQFGPFAIGGYTHLESYAAEIDGRSVDVVTTRSHLGGAWAFMQGQLVVGGGLRVLRTSLAASTTEGETLTLDLFSFVGYGLELGAVYRPADRQFRLGASLRGPVHAQVDPALSSVGGSGPQVPRPSGFRSPFELRLGVAYQFGPRRLNFRSFENKGIERRVL